MIRSRARFLLRSPAVHFLLAGGLLYLASTSLGPGEAGDGGEVRELRLSTAQVERLREDLRSQLGRPPSQAQLEEAVRRRIDEEVLLDHALDLGLDREPAVERRLAQIAGFVSTTEPAQVSPVEAGSTIAEGSSAVDGSYVGGDRASQAELAELARQLGLHRSDRVARNISIDRASRLIRAAILAHEPTEAALEAHLVEHADLFRAPDRLALEHVEVRDDDPATARARAEALLPRLRAAEADPATLGDRPSVPSRLRAQPERALARRFGHSFAEALADLPEGTWAGPLASRYGWHLVRITERRPGPEPTLEPVRDDVRAHWRHQHSERWLRERLAQLRATYRIEIAGQQVPPSVLAAATEADEEVSS